MINFIKKLFRKKFILNNTYDMYYECVYSSNEAKNYEIKEPTVKLKSLMEDTSNWRYDKDNINIIIHIPSRYYFKVWKTTASLGFDLNPAEHMYIKNTLNSLISALKTEKYENNRKTILTNANKARQEVIKTLGGM